MTGLDPENDTIIEIATVITDAQLAFIAKGPELAIHQSDAVLAGMDDWNQRHHGDSGLIERVKTSEHSLAMAQQLTLAFLEQHVPAGASPMCGNSICQDRRFLARLMPTLERYFHYRHIDVSSIKELARRWRPALFEGLVKRGAHRAYDDICESIAELQYYREHWLGSDK